MISSITEAQATEIVKPHGFVARRVRPGFYINRGGDDLMYISSVGEVTPYKHDAQAFYAASRLGAAIRADLNQDR